MKIKHLVFAGFLIFTEMASAKVATRLSRSRRFASVAVGSAILSWSPSGSVDDFIAVAPQTFNLTNSGTAIANGLTFSAPIILDFGSYVAMSGHFVISGTTCGASLGIGASCTVDIQYFNCNLMCTMVIPSISNGTVSATSGSVNATLSNLLYNANEI